MKKTILLEEAEKPLANGSLSATEENERKRLSNFSGKMSFVIASLLIFFIADAEACCFFDDTNFYAKLLGGVNCLQDTTLDGNRSTYNPGYIVAGSLGYCWHYGLSLEAEYAYRRNAIRKIDFVIEGISDEGHLQTSSYMGNLFWNLSSLGLTYHNFQPFAGLGLGYDSQKMHASNSRVIFNQKWRHFSWQLIAGLAYPILCNTNLTLEYRFHQGGHHFYSHSLGLGLVYNFGYL